MQFFPLNPLEKLLNGIWQHICCISYHFQDMRESQRTNCPKNEEVLYLFEAIRYSRWLPLPLLGQNIWTSSPKLLHAKSSDK